MPSHDQGETMSRVAQESSDQALTFGPFRLLRMRKQLLEGDKPVRLGSRALDLLIALVERAGEVVSREELEACVWPSTIVEETSLRVHVSALRKALGDGHGGARFIANVPGRGYCFVAPVARPRETPMPDAIAPAHRPVHNLPARLSPMIGRTEAVDALTQLLVEHRFVTVTGPGGMGKTTVALAVAEDLLASYAHGVRFVDLAPIVDPLLLPSTVATAVEFSVSSHDPISALSAFLHDKNMLIVLDSCEHVIEAAAGLAERLLKGAPGISVLATSREPLNAEGEWVYRLSPLETPPASEHLTAAQALTFPAIQLFVQRARGISDRFELHDADAPVLRDLCRQLDGMPLAIEFAAARVDSLGLHGLAAGLDDRLRLLTRGRRTALPRHRTLGALLDWSYDLLSVPEQSVLCRLAVFKAGFTLEAACAVASDEETAAADVVECVMNLAAKSLIATDASGDVIVYRLLESTRAYAVEKLFQTGQAAIVFRRHAAYMLDLITRAEAAWDAMTRTQWMATYCRCIDDVRAALEWSFSNEGDPAIGVALTAVAQLPIYELGLLDEYHEHIERALNHIHLLSPAQPVLEMRLNAALSFRSGVSTRQGRPQATVIARTLELAEQLGEPKLQIAAVYSAWVGAFGTGDYPAAVAAAERISKLARDSADPAGILLSDRLTAQTLHFIGDQTAAQRLAERVLRHPDIPMPPGYTSPVPRSVSMRIVLSRILWLEGRPDQAVGMAEECVEQAAGAHTIALSQALGMAACPIALWRGDNVAARALVDRLMDLARHHSSDYWQSWAQTYDAVLSARASIAASTVQAADAPDRPRPFIGASNAKQLDCAGTLAEGLVDASTIARVEAGTVGWCAPEILRAQGESLLRAGTPEAASAAESCYLRSLDLARHQAALSWEMRTAISLGRLWRARRRVSEARELVATTYERFTEGFDTADLRAAKSLLLELKAESNAV
jgi:predicted ATPase/DNA-binding winged helix-turn-helix (wHTH) protein